MLTCLNVVFEVNSPPLIVAVDAPDDALDEDLVLVHGWTHKSSRHHHHHHHRQEGVRINAIGIISRFPKSIKIRKGANVTITVLQVEHNTAPSSVFSLESSAAHLFGQVENIFHNK